MTRFVRRLSAFALAGAFFALSPLAFAHEAKIGALTLGHPWTRATPARAPVAGGYTKITNAGTESDRLIGGTAEFAGRVEIHEMTMSNGVMTIVRGTVPEAIFGGRGYGSLLGRLAQPQFVARASAPVAEERRKSARKKKEPAFRVLPTVATTSSSWAAPH